MIKPGEIEKQIPQTVNRIKGDLTVHPDKLIWRNELTHPVSREGKPVPQENKHQKVFKLGPARPLNLGKGNPVEKIAHAEDKEEMANLVGNQTLGAAMLLNGKSRHNAGEVEEKKKGEENNFKNHQALFRISPIKFS